VANDRKSEGFGRKPDTERRENGFPSFAVLRPTFFIGKTSIFADRFFQDAKQIGRVLPMASKNGFFGDPSAKLKLDISERR
jgi:hypothetical protein